MESFVHLRTPGLRQHTLHDEVIHAVMTFNIFSISKLQLERKGQQNSYAYFLKCSHVAMKIPEFDLINMIALFVLRTKTSDMTNGNAEHHGGR